MRLRGFFVAVAVLAACQVSALSVEEIQSKANSENPIALREVADAYAGGVGVPRDIEAAFGFYQRAAALGDSEAQFAAAYMLLRGNGAVENEAAGVKFMTAAAKQDHPAATLWVGIILFEKAGSENQAVALGWLKRAQLLKAPGASDYLGRALIELPTTADSLQELHSLLEARDLSPEVRAEISSLDYLPILGEEDAKYLQQSLMDAGFDPKGLDGQIGPNSKQALAAFRQSKGRSGEAVLSVLDLKALSFF